MGALEGLLVVDLTQTQGEFAGRVLADLGAEVIAVEPLGGSARRSQGPFAADGTSLTWLTLNTNKQICTLTGDSEADRLHLLDLISSADVVIESFEPGSSGTGTLKDLGLVCEDLRVRNPGLVIATISAYGSTGPKSDWPATDLTVEAAGGLTGMQGDGDRAPLPVGYPQASFHAGVQAAADILIALNERHHSGSGQHLDVSAQAAVVWTLMNATGYTDAVGANPPGFCEQRAQGRQPPIPGMRPARLLQVADGYVVIGLHLPGIGERTMQGAMEWLQANHPELVDEQLISTDWRGWMDQVRSAALSIDVFNRGYDLLAQAFTQHRKLELLDLAIERSILIAPVLNVADLLEDPQLHARDFWRNVEGLRVPGPFARLTRTPITYTEAVKTLDPATVVRSSWPRPQQQAADRSRAFEGLKVADFAWVGVGPIMSKALADHGATVIHIESSSRLDVLRLLPPFKDAQAGLNRSQFFANFNTSKRGIEIDLQTEAGLAYAREIAAWADVIVESFTPGTMARFGLDFETLSKTRRDLVMLSTCMRGQTGPQRSYSGFGNQGAALSGLFAITGWPDRPPSGPWGAYTDFVAPRYGVSALAAALLNRQKTGLGQHIDLSQIEAGIHFTGPQVAHFSSTGTCAGAVGNRRSQNVPQGSFQTRGLERYIALEVRSDRDWRALCALLEDAALNSNWGLAERAANVDLIDDHLCAWTLLHDADDAEAQLVAEGIPAHRIMWPGDLRTDAQLAHRGFFVPLEHPEMGVMHYDGPVTHFSATPPVLDRPGPLLGQHSEEVAGWFKRG